MSQRNDSAPFNVSDIDTNFGSGGGGINGRRTGKPNASSILTDLLSRISRAVANVAGLTATLAKDRVDGMLVVTLDTYTLWVWQAASASTADSKHIAPTDVGSGNGRWVDLVDALSGSQAGSIQSGSTTLVAGTSPAISAAVTANTRIIGFVKTMTPGAGNLTVQYGALATDRVVGAVGTGSFKIKALVAAGTINVNDVSVVDWIAIG